MAGNNSWANFANKLLLGGGFVRTIPSVIASLTLNKSWNLQLINWGSPNVLGIIVNHCKVTRTQKNWWMAIDLCADQAPSGGPKSVNHAHQCRVETTSAIWTKWEKGNLSKELKNYSEPSPTMCILQKLYTCSRVHVDYKRTANICVQTVGYTFLSFRKLSLVSRCCCYLTRRNCWWIMDEQLCNETRP